MTEPCSCPIAGWCDRHKVKKHKVWHQLCQSHDDYRKAWDKGRGPGQPRKPLTRDQLERKERVKQSVARDDRLLGWLAFFRHPGEVGVGDTARRLNMQSCKSPDAHELLTRLLKQCSCTPADAVAKLNKEHPYPANTRNLGGS